MMLVYFENTLEWIHLLVEVELEEPLVGRFPSLGKGLGLISSFMETGYGDAHQLFQHSRGGGRRIRSSRPFLVQGQPELQKWCLLFC